MTDGDRNDLGVISPTDLSICLDENILVGRSVDGKMALPRIFQPDVLLVHAIPGREGGNLFSVSSNATLTPGSSTPKRTPEISEKTNARGRTHGTGDIEAPITIPVARNDVRGNIAGQSPPSTIVDWFRVRRMGREAAGRSPDQVRILMENAELTVINEPAYESRLDKPPKSE